MWSLERKVEILINRRLEPFKKQVHVLQATIWQLQSTIKQQQLVNARLFKEHGHLRQNCDTLVDEKRKDVLSTMAREHDYIGTVWR